MERLSKVVFSIHLKDIIYHVHIYTLSKKSKSMCSYIELHRSYESLHRHSISALGKDILDLRAIVALGQQQL